MYLKNKHILLLTSEFPPQPGGIGQHALDLARQLSVSYKLKLIADQRSVDGLEELNFDQHLNFEVVRVKRLKLLVFTYILRIIKSIKAAHSSEIILVSGKFSLWQVHFLKLFYPTKPILSIIHGSEVLLPNQFAQFLTNSALEKVDHTIAVSKYTLSLVKHLKLKARTIIPNGISMIPAFKMKHLNSTSPQLVTVGNLTQRKGQHNLINALPKLLKYYPNLHYHCIGLKTEFNRLQNLVREIGLEQSVTFYGRLTEDEKNKIYQISDLFVMLSEQTSSGDVEGFGIAILEANSFGIPAVGSSGSGVEDAIKDTYSGRLVNPHDTEAVVASVVSIFNNFENYQQNAYQWVQEFKWQKIIKQYQIIIDELCA